MNILFGMIEIAATFIEIYILFKIFAEILHRYCKKNVKIKEIWLIIAGTIVVQLCNHIALVSYFTPIISVLYVSSVAAILYTINFISIFSIASFYIVCVSYVDFLVISIISSFWNGEQTVMEMLSTAGYPRMLLICIVKMIWICLYFLLKKYLYIFSDKVKHNYWLLTISIAGFIGVIFLIEQTCRAFNYTLTGIWLLAVGVLAFFLFASFYFISLKEEIMKLNFIKAHNEMLAKNYKAISDIYTSNAKLYHDMNNHLNVLYQLVESGANEDAKAYIKEIGKPVMKLAKVVWTGEDVVDVVINSKLQKMEEKGIDSEFNVEFPYNTNITQNDMCTILANLLDNAIEATEKMNPPGKVMLTMRRIKQFLFIQVANTCITDLEDMKLETTKEDKALHGWGLANVKDAVERYGGTIEYSNSNNMFTVSIMLFFTLKRDV